MRIFLYVGWGLLLTAFVITAADPFLTLLQPVSKRDVW